MKLQNYLNDTRSLFSLALPIFITQLIPNLMSFFDTVMAGQVSALDLAAVALASSVWMPIVLTTYGLMMALATLVAQYSGAKQTDKIKRITIQVLWLALALSMLLIVLFLLIIPFARTELPLDKALSEMTLNYLAYIVWGAPCCFLFMALRNFTEGISLTKPTMIISIIGLILNIPLNYIFIYGELGVSAYGGAGCGIATAIVYGLMFVMMLIYVNTSAITKPYALFHQWIAPNLSELKLILKLGVPIALSLLFEVSLFSVVAILLAPFGAIVVASHQVALNFTGILFMIPLSLAMAVTIKVGNALGENNIQKSKQVSKHAFITGLIIASFTALGTYCLRVPIAEIYSNDPEVIQLAASLMFLACLYQFSDAIQVISAGALRGYQDTNAILWITFISYWIIGLSIGYALASTNLLVNSLGPAGYWIGFIVGLSTAAVLLFWRLKKIQGRLSTTILDEC